MVESRCGRIPSRRRRTALLLCLALAAAACGSDNDTSETANSTTTGDGEAPSTSTDDGDVPATTADEGAPLTASATGVTAETITVGIPVVDVDVFANIGDSTPFYEALVEMTNEAGGIGGRMVEIHTERFPITDPVKVEAACIALTEDVETFAIVGFLVPGFTDVPCYSDRHEKITIVTEAVSPDDTSVSEGRLMTTASSGTDLLINGLPLLEADLAGKNVVVYSGGEQASRLPEAVEALEAVGANVVYESVQTIGGDDLLAAEAELDIAVERWQTEDVEWVVNLDGSIAGSLAALQRAGRDDVGVVYAGTETATLTALGADLSLTETLIGIGVLNIDFLYDQDLYGTVECVDKLSEATGIPLAPFVPDGEVDRLNTAVKACGAWETFVKFAEAAGPDLTTESFLEAGYDLGEFELVGAPSGSLEPDKPFLGNGEPQVFVYDAAQDLFVPR